MSKRPTALERAIQSLDDQIKALELARTHLVAQQKNQAALKAPARPPRKVSVVVGGGNHE